VAKVKRKTGARRGPVRRSKRRGLPPLPRELERLLTVREVAEVLNLDPSAVYRLIAHGQLPVVRPTIARRAVRVHPADLRDYISASAALGRPRRPRRRRA